jgi:excinuclease ABC subunit C
MKDAAGRVIYVGKAKNLRSRAGSYFLKAAAEDPRTAKLVVEIRDLDFLPAESELDALLIEARLIKDIQPKYNRDLRDDKTFPYLEIQVREDFPRVRFTRTPKGRGSKLFGPFANPRQLRGAIQVLQKVFKFRTCGLDIVEGDPRWRWFRPCLLHSIQQCCAPCNLRISKEDYRKAIRRLQRFLEGGRQALLGELRAEMERAARELRFEEAARLRDEMQLLENLDQRGRLDRHVQPEVFPIDPKKGLAGLQKVLHLGGRPRTIEGVDIAHTGGTETVAAVVRFIDGLPFKPGYRRYRIRSVAGVDDFASIREVVARRFRPADDDGQENEPPPDILLIDGGVGQLAAAMAALAGVELAPATVVALAKREELIYVAGRDEPLRLSRHAYALRLLQYVRDEAHRFAQHYHHILRRRSALGE